MTIRAFPATILFSLALFFVTSVAAIDESQVIDPKGTQVEEVEKPDPMSGILSSNGTSVGMFVTLLGYALILGAIVVAVWILLKRGFLRKPFAKTEGKLKVSETRMLGNRQFIMVVEYEDQKILLGVGPGKIDYLTSLSSYRGEFPEVDQNVGKMSGGNT